MDKTFYLYVSNPNVSFVINEVDFLSQKGEVVLLCNEENKGNINEKISQFTSRIIWLEGKNKSKLVAFKTILLHPYLLLILINDTFSKNTNLAYLKQFFYRSSLLLTAFNRQASLIKQIADVNIENGVQFMSFNFDDTALTLSLAKKEGVIKSYSSRCHGRDTYEFREKKTNKLPFRYFQLSNVSQLFSANKDGERYLKNRYPKYRDKIHSNYLGTKDFGTGPYHETEVFTIVSCGKVRNVKRYYLIPLILQELNFPIKWIHFGEIQVKDPTYNIFINNINKLKENNKLVEVELTGKLNNDDLMEFYKRNVVNLFLSVSETEGGCPVSIQEAISFGIPVFGTDAGGTREIVNENTGVLFPVNFDPKEVAKLILLFKESNKNMDQFRKNVRKFWENNFVGVENVNKYLNSLNAD